MISPIAIIAAMTGAVAGESLPAHDAVSGPVPCSGARRRDKDQDVTAIDNSQYEYLEVRLHLSLFRLGSLTSKVFVHYFSLISYSFEFLKYFKQHNPPG